MPPHAPPFRGGFRLAILGTVAEIRSRPDTWPPPLPLIPPHLFPASPPLLTPCSLEDEELANFHGDGT